MSEGKRLEFKLKAMKHGRPRGFALTLPPAPSGKPPAAKCIKCSGNAIARAICAACFATLCRRHSVELEGRSYCHEHKPGYN